jgi:two-component system, cell cycle sensor histidine kinase and response regulator CckA
LATVYGIVKNHKGIIDLKSQSGQGTTFTTYLPAKDKQIHARPTAAESSRELKKGEETILLVDDEQITRDVAAAMLEQLGYRIMTADSGKSAIEIYQQHRGDIDLVILDMIMPDLGGGPVYDRLKKINPEVKVLLSSGYSIDGQATDILNKGCNGFIQKPFNLKRLSEKLRTILDSP